MGSRRKGLVIFLSFLALMVSAFALGAISTWLAFLPLIAFALGMCVLALWSARAAGRTTMDLSPLPVYRLTMGLVAVGTFLFALLLGAGCALNRAAPHAPTGSFTQKLEVQTGAFYVTPGQAAAYQALEIALVIAFGATFVVGVLWHFGNHGAWQRGQE